MSISQYNQAKIYYLEVVTQDVRLICESYKKTLGLSFGDPVTELGDARTATLSNGEILGVRAPMHEAEEPATRPYYLVDDIEKAVAEAEASGAEIAVPPMEIPGHGKCAILFYGEIQSGLWQV